MYKHGLSNHYLYETWSGMKKRCYCTTSKDYKHYGARGVSVCDAWRNDFPTFLDYILTHLGERPDGCSLDRFPNKNGNYEPGNVRWATQSQQSKNRKHFKLTKLYLPKTRGNESGFRWVKSVKNRFKGEFKHRGTTTYCGSFLTGEEAYAAVIERRVELGLPVPD